MFVACVFGKILKDVPSKIAKTEPTYKKKKSPREFLGPETAEKKVSPGKKKSPRKKNSLGDGGGHPLLTPTKPQRSVGPKVFIGVCWGVGG